MYVCCVHYSSRRSVLVEVFQLRRKYKKNSNNCVAINAIDNNRKEPCVLLEQRDIYSRSYVVFVGKY